MVDHLQREEVRFENFEVYTRNISPFFDQICNHVPIFDTDGPQMVLKEKFKNILVKMEENRSLNMQ